MLCNGVGLRRLQSRSTSAPEMGSGRRPTCPIFVLILECPSRVSVCWPRRSSPAKAKSPAGKKVVRKVDTPMSCADTPTGGKDGDASIAAEVEAVTLALEKEEEEAAIDESPEKEEDDAGDADWVEEERKLREENRKREEENRRKNNKMGMKEKVALLDNLLQKAAAYTAFLRERMKDTSATEPVAGAAKKSPKKRDGQFEHQERDPRQPKLVEGVMRKYQIEGLMWICSLYENGLNGILAGASPATCLQHLLCPPPS